MRPLIHRQDWEYHLAPPRQIAEEVDVRWVEYGMGLVTVKGMVNANAAPMLVCFTTLWALLAEASGLSKQELQADMTFLSEPPCQAILARGLRIAYGMVRWNIRRSNGVLA